MFDSRAIVSLLLATALVSSACRSGPAVGADGQPVPESSRSATDLRTMAPVNVSDTYKAMGLIAGRGAMPFVARVAFFPDRYSDSTLVMVSMSLSPRYLSFAREDNQYAGGYTVRLDLRRGPNLVRQVEAKETVRVATFRETARTDESLIWQQFVRMAPGQYSLSVGVRDASSPRASGEEVTLTVPAFDSVSLSSPVPVYEVAPRTTADSIPSLLARPRATVTFGVDAVVPVYIEVSSTREATRIRTEVRGEGDALLWRDSMVLLGRGGDLVSGTVLVPAASIGVGVVSLQVTQSDRPDTARTQLLVTLGEDLPVTSFDEMIRYLQFFASSSRLERLANTSGLARAQAWSEFLKSTDPVPSTPEHEGLSEYFARIRLANQRFRDDANGGWLSDRGIAFIGLGEPDNIFEPMVNEMSQRNRQQIWEYRRWRLQLVYFDETGLGRWRLSPGQSVELAATIRRRLAELP
jgi:GWxTD domain-containing protein